MGTEGNKIIKNTKKDYLKINFHQLEHEITLDEVTKSLLTLNNNRVPGYDKIIFEMIKYGPEEVYLEITSILNNCILI